MEQIKTLDGSTIFFHNLKFDGNFILNYLLKNGYELTEERKLNKRQFSTLISDTGAFYQIKIKFDNSNEVLIWNSLNKIQGSVENIGKSFKTKYQKLSIDYIEDRPEGYKMTPEEEEYVKNDVRIIAEALQFLLSQGMDRMTAASDAFNFYIDMIGGKQRFRQGFPILDYETHEYCKKAYRGGFCYCLRPGYYNETGNTYDVNSLYPSVMHSSSGNIYPYGDPIFEDYGEGITDDEFESRKVDKMPLYIVRIIADFKLKDGFLPTIQLKNSVKFFQSDYITNSDGPAELYLTNVDYKLFKDHYEINALSVKSCMRFKAKAGFFDDYINYFYNLKRTAKGALRQWAKIMLNSFYGRFALALEQLGKSPKLKGGAVVYSSNVSRETNPVYIPVAVFTTAYARDFTIRAAQKNYDNFIYADTDSLHLLGDAKGIRIHESDMNSWKHESEWTEGVFVRQKTYMEKINGQWEIKAAGMNDASKEFFLKEVANGTITVKDFKIGLRITGFKLMPKAVEGGIVLKPDRFEIREKGTSAKKSDKYLKINENISFKIV